LYRGTYYVIPSLEVVDISVAVDVVDDTVVEVPVVDVVGVSENAVEKQ